MPDFDPFKDGSATAVEDGGPGGFDPFKEGTSDAHVPAIAHEEGSTPEEVNSAPNVGTDWNNLYRGINPEWDAMLNPEQRAVFKKLDLVSDNSLEARMQAINQAYLSTRLKDIPHSTMERNWPSIRDGYANDALGIPGTGITEQKLYQAIGKQLVARQATETGKVKAWQDVDWKDPKAPDTFWQAINKPVMEIPEAPPDLPDISLMGLYNPAVAGGVYNALKPLVEGVESPLGIATLGAGPALKLAGETYPLARAALVGMGGVFTGLMGYGTAKAVIAAPAVLKDPNATKEEKITAVVAPLADAAVTLLGAVGTALEMFPKERATVVMKELEGKNPAQAAEVFRREAVETDIPQHSDFLMDAAHELDRIATVKDKEAVKTEAKSGEAVDIGKRDETVSTGTGVSTPHEEKMNAEWAKAMTEETGIKVPGSEPAKDTGLIGIKNEAVDAELEKMGLPAATHDEKVTFKGELAKAEEISKADPAAGEKLVEELGRKTRPVTSTEDALLLREMNRLRLERDAAESDFIGASTEGDAGDMMAAKMRVAAARDKFQQAADVVTKVGTKNAQGLALRRMMLKEDYSLAAIERRRVVANQGKPLSDEQQTEVRDLHKQLTEAQQKIDRYEDQRRAARDAPVKEAPKARPPTSKARQFLSDQAAAARERIKAKLSSGRVSAGIDPTDIADYAIVGAEYIATGLTKFADWSVAMVNDLGEHIRPHLQEIFKQAIQAKADGTKLQAYKTRLETGTKKLQEKLAAGDTSKPERRPLPLDKEAIRLKAEYERTKRKVDLAQQAAELKSRTPLEYGKDLALAVNRAGVLSRLGIVVKLSAIIAQRAVMTPVRQAIGYGVSKVLPGVARQARFEDVPTFGGLVRSESKALTAMLTKGLPGAWDILRMKDTDLQALLEKEHLPPGVLSYPSHIHAALHYPIQVADYARRLQLTNERDIRAGIDMTEPVNQLRNMQEAWEYSKRSIFLQNNKAVAGYQNLVKTLESVDKDTGKPNPMYQMIAVGLQSENPVLKVPVNFAEELSEHVAGLMDPPLRLAFKGVGGFRGLSYGEADMILRHVKNGALGAALVLLGFFKYKQVGGFYDASERRKKNDVGPGELRVGSVTIPSIALKDVSFEAMNAGATLHRTLDATYRLNDPQKKGIPAALLAVGVGIAEETPFIRDASILGKILDPRQREHAVASDIASKMVPGFVQEIAAYGDKKYPLDLTERPQSRVITAPDFTGALKQNLMKEIPGLREKLPKRNPNTTLRP